MRLRKIKAPRIPAANWMISGKSKACAVVSCAHHDGVKTYMYKARQLGRLSISRHGLSTIQSESQPYRTGICCVLAQSEACSAELLVEVYPDGNVVDLHLQVHEW